jgi:hypothetical protein
VDVRSFGTEKSPRSPNERVAVVAYYLAELAPETERKAEISAADITKYFKQAGFPLPGAARMTLVNARNAGYLDAGADRGTYRLNCRRCGSLFPQSNSGRPDECASSTFLTSRSMRPSASRTTGTAGESRSTAPSSA